MAEDRRGAGPDQVRQQFLLLGLREAGQPLPQRLGADGFVSSGGRRTSERSGGEGHVRGQPVPLPLEGVGGQFGAGRAGEERGPVGGEAVGVQAGEAGGEGGGLAAVAPAEGDEDGTVAFRAVAGQAGQDGVGGRVRRNGPTPAEVRAATASANRTVSRTCRTQ
ncbi:hypothetical protein GCM10017687_90720 [Streptomyces echinatus]